MWAGICRLVMSKMSRIYRDVQEAQGHARYEVSEDVATSDVRCEKM
jgi:hypothetical protein